MLCPVVYYNTSTGTASFPRSASAQQALPKHLSHSQSPPNQTPSNARYPSPPIKRSPAQAKAVILKFPKTLSIDANGADPQDRRSANTHSLLCYRVNGTPILMLRFPRFGVLVRSLAMEGKATRGRPECASVELRGMPNKTTHAPPNLDESRSPRGKNDETPKPKPA